MMLNEDCVNLAFYLQTANELSRHKQKIILNNLIFIHPPESESKELYQCHAEYADMCLYMESENFKILWILHYLSFQPSHC